MIAGRLSVVPKMCDLSNHWIMTTSARCKVLSCLVDIKLTSVDKGCFHIMEVLGEAGVLRFPRLSIIATPP
jgi:hypothetical protein